jgi:hypothetical protein
MRRLRPPCLALAAFLSAPAAHAGPGFDVDLSMGPHLGAGTDYTGTTIAYAVAGRAGWRFDLGPFWIQPEAGGEYTAIRDTGFVDVTGAATSTVTSFQIARALFGVRIGGRIARVVEPALYAHGAVAFLLGQQGVGPAVDAGIALDLALVPRFRFGIHSAYNYATFFVPTCTEGILCDEPPTSGRPHVDWLTYGVHAGMGF